MRETFVGIFIIFGVILVIFMYIWLSGRISLRNTYDVTVYFQDVMGLRIGDPVMIYGMEMGKVKSLEYESGAITVILAVDRRIMLPKDSQIAIRSVSYVASDRFIKVIMGSSDEFATTFNGRSDAFDLEDIAARFDTLFSSIEGIDINAIGDVAKDLSKDIDRNMKRLVTMMNKPVTALESVIVKTDHVIEELDSLTALMQSDGTVGKLMRSDSLYEELRGSNQALRELLEDIKENPAKYLKNIKIL
ncbi:MCE family protein [candidate division WOR-3 bacterium]|nr:MCE family protein [candidate division WOR-3 bacterium]